MSFALHVDAEQWRAGTEAVRDSVRAAIGPGPGDLVPVAKGNGYGLGNARLAREAARLGVGCLAVGTAGELADVADAFAGDLLVLAPYEPADTCAAADWAALSGAGYAHSVVRTVSSAAGLRALLAGASAEAPVRVVLEGFTSMRRFGFEPADLTSVLADSQLRAALAAGALRIEGLALHLPITQPATVHRDDPGAPWHDAAVAPAPPAGASGRVQEVLAWAYTWGQLLADLSLTDADAAAADIAAAALSAAPTLWVSHLDDGELEVVGTALPDTALRVRIGTRLWLGARSALVARGTVLAVHQVRRGQRSGYRQRRTSRDSVLLVVGGGTAHGVALEAPSAVSSVRQRVVAAGSGVLEAGGLALSPFSVAGKQRWFAEPPHMQVSLVHLAAGVPAPVVGDEVDCDVRLTTATFDRIVGLD
ncbi:MAG TPA: alanine racemase [Candidatus Nanopelagicales bacterium]|jgi:alanine racemase